MKTILFTNARDEPHICEWAAHHLLLGFDQIVIFDHKSKTPITTPFKRVRVVPVGNMATPIKIPLMIMAARIAKQAGATWMLYLDADEFLVMGNSSTGGIKTYLSHIPPAVSQIAINWLMFGTSGLIDELVPTTDLIIDKYLRSDEHLNKHVKCIVRPHTVAGADNPHFFKTRTGISIGIDGRPFIAPFHDFKQPRPFFTAPLFIAHYVFQSENTYRRRKLDLPRDDNGTMRIDNNIKSIHDQFNVRDNFMVQRLYSSRVRAFLRATNLIK